MVDVHDMIIFLSELVLEGTQSRIWNNLRITLKLKDLFTERGNTKGLITKHEAEEQGCLRMEKINTDYK